MPKRDIVGIDSVMSDVMIRGKAWVFEGLGLGKRLLIWPGVRLIPAMTQMG